MLDIIIIIAVLAVIYQIYKKFYMSEETQAKELDVNIDPTVFNLKKGWTVDFHDSFILTGFPLQGFNILENGPYEVVGMNKTTDTTEYTLRGGSGDAVLEVEKKGGRSVILIQTGLESFPSLLPAIKKIWNENTETFSFKGAEYFLVDRGEEVDDEEECRYWDYYSDPINEGNKLFIGVQDYGDEGKPELEFFVGFEIPERSIKEIVQGS